MQHSVWTHYCAGERSELPSMDSDGYDAPPEFPTLGAIFMPRYWKLDAVLDLVFPVVASVAVALVVQFLL